MFISRRTFCKQICKIIFIFIDRRVIPDAMAWRHHDSDVNDTFPDDDFSILDVRALAENIIDLRRCILVFSLPLVWLPLGIFLAFIPFLKIPKGMVIPDPS
ncbi:hypothetical protein Tco_1359874 [Tanacetum coccineum]